MARRLHSSRLAPFVGEPFLDRVGQRHQQMAGQRRRARRHELAHPAIEVAGGIAVEALHRPRDVGQFLRRVGKGKELRPRVDLAAGLVVDDALDREPVFDRQRRPSAGKRRDGDAIIERVVKPTEPPRLRVDVELRRQQPLIVAVARTHHHPVVAKLDRPRVAVDGQMADVQNGPAGLQFDALDLFSSSDGDWQIASFLIQRNRDKFSTRKFDVGVFTQPGPLADIVRSDLKFVDVVQTGRDQPGGKRAALW